MTRDGAGRRRLGEIALLRRSGGGLVRVVTAWHADHGSMDAAAELDAVLRTRMPA
ncbi:conjugal transfer protein TrbB [Mycobacterium sp. MS3]